MAIIVSGQFGSSVATQSPFSTPDFFIHLANEATFSLSSFKVRLKLSLPSPWKLIAWRSSSPTRRFSAKFRVVLGKKVAFLISLLGENAFSSKLPMTSLPFQTSLQKSSRLFTLQLWRES